VWLSRPGVRGMDVHKVRAKRAAVVMCVCASVGQVLRACYDSQKCGRMATT
jgi:hypothetical protein